MLTMDDPSLLSAEKEATEVLRSLLSLGRVDRVAQDEFSTQVVSDAEWNDVRQAWHTPMDQGSPTLSDEMSEMESSDLLRLADPPVPAAEPPLPETVQTVPPSGKKPPAKKKAGATEKKKRPAKGGEKSSELENSAQEVRNRFDRGCECSDDSCFRGLNPETVYKHRLNIAELTKEEHDMYLMGLTMACMSDPSTTVKHRDRQRLRSHYMYHGRRVCLAAFLYLENCTLYQIKMIRKHVMTHGVTPRVHGNHGKKPHNVFSLDIYRRATFFLKSFIQQHSNSSNSKAPVNLPPEITRKSVHSTYIDYVKCVGPSNEKYMGYSTFRYFMKEQFPNLKFAKVDYLGGSGNTSKSGKNGVLEGAKEGSTVEVSVPVILQECPSETPTYIVQEVLRPQQYTAVFQPQQIQLTAIPNNTYSFSSL